MCPCECEGGGSGLPVSSLHLSLAVEFRHPLCCFGRPHALALLQSRPPE